MINRRVRKNIFWILFGLLIASACSKPSSQPTGYDWSLAVIGDVRQGFGIYGQHIRHILLQDPLPEAAFCMGDIMLRAGNQVEWESFWHVSKPLTDKMPLFLVRGNHEGNKPEFEKIYSQQTGLPVGHFYYSLRIRNTACIVLDTEVRGEEESIGPVQFNWLQRELDTIENDSAISHIFIFLHRPVFSFGEYQGTKLRNAGALHALFLTHPKIKAVFSGHDHVYNRHIRDGLNYITTCGGGEPLYDGAGGNYYHFVLLSFDEQKQRVNLKTIGLFNEVVEDFNL